MGAIVFFWLCIVAVLIVFGIDIFQKMRRDFHN
jgi:hypothetical protein